MYIAYSALRAANHGPHEQLPETGITGSTGTELLLRYQAYRAACSKYRREIAAIQQYMPGWEPIFK